MKFSLPTGILYFEMNSLFNYIDYRKFLNERLKHMPKRGHGQMRKLAAFLNVHTTLTSQIFSGSKDFTLEQASLTAEFFGLNELETEYFLTLVQLSRAGNESLKKNLKKQISNIQKKAAELVNRVPVKATLTEEQRAIFYSDWTYTTIGQLVAIKGLNTIDAISDYLDMPRNQVSKVLEFLVQSGLCLEEKGNYKIGPTRTHVESTSPWVRIHHINWRQKAIEQISREYPTKLHYTCPVTLSKSDANKIREMIIKFVESINGVVDPSESQELHCINIDWFKI